MGRNQIVETGEPNVNRRINYGVIVDRGGHEVCTKLYSGVRLKKVGNYLLAYRNRDECFVSKYEECRTCFAHKIIQKLLVTKGRFHYYLVYIYQC